MTDREFSKEIRGPFRKAIGQNQALTDEVPSLRSDVAIVKNQVQNHRLMEGDGEGTGFPNFSGLPLELQNMIWEVACFSEPRITRFRVEKCFYSTSNKYRVSWVKNAPPSILHATSGSRSEALRWYQKWHVKFQKYKQYESCQREVLMSKGAEVQQTYFNFDIDILYLATDEGGNNQSFPVNWVEFLMKSRTLCQFRRIAFPDEVHIHLDDLPYPDNLASEIAREESEREKKSWLQAKKFLLKPRSKIEEIIVLRGGLSFSNNKKRLISLSDDDILAGFDHTTTTVKEKLNRISTWLNQNESENDGLLNEDESSDDEGPASAHVTSQQETGTNTVQAANKPMPQLRFMDLVDVNRLPISGLYR